MEQSVFAADRRARRRFLWGLALVFLVAAAFAVGRVTAPPREEDRVPVVVRQGPLTLGPDQDALLTVQGDLIEDLVQQGLAGADVPFELDHVDAEFVSDGLRISGRVGIDVRGIPLRAAFTTTAHPHARPDGTVGVELSNTRAVGARLPGLFEEFVQAAVNSELTAATRLDGYRVDAVEVGPDALLVFLVVEKSAGISTAFD